MTVISTVRLDIVNEVLTAGGLSPLTQLTAAAANTNVDEKIAVAAVDRHTSRGQLVKDWKFNYAEDVTFTANGGGNVILGTESTFNMARVLRHESDRIVAASASDPDYVERKNGTDWMLYDVKNKTFNLGAGTTVRLDITYRRDLDECPECFRRYVSAMAKIDFLTARKHSRDAIALAMRERDDTFEELLRDHQFRGALGSQRRARRYVTILDNYSAARPIQHRGPIIAPL